MNKKGGIKFSAPIFALIIIICIIALYLVITQMKEVMKFNPATDDCDEWKPTGATNNPNMTDIKYDRYYEISQGWYRCDECTKWHKKSPCQIDPNAEGCVCDEYNINTTNCVIADESLNLFLCDYTWIQTENGWETEGTLITRSCIKSHEANPCELGDEDYIWEDYTAIDCHKHQMGHGCPNKTSSKTCRKKTPCELGDEDYILDERVIGCDGIEESILGGNICIGNQLTEDYCRAKIIYDYNCSVLMENILKDNTYCPNDNKFVVHRSLGVDCQQINGYDYEEYTHSELVDIAKEKQCKGLLE